MQDRKFKLGRLPRLRDKRVPQLSLLAPRQNLPPLPKSVDWAAGIAQSALGVMLNDTLGDCTCAAFGHAVQVWTHAAQAGAMVTLPDSAIESLYEAVGGYVPGEPNTDQGAAEQTVLTYLVNTGLDNDKLAGFVEIDTGRLDDVRRSILEGGLVYIGFDVPTYLMQHLEQPGSFWRLMPDEDNTIEGGHAVILTGYDAQGFNVISWGGFYKMGFGFFEKFVDEAYVLADRDWIEKTGNTPAGLTLDALQELMAELREAKDKKKK